MVGGCKGWGLRVTKCRRMQIHIYPFEIRLRYPILQLYKKPRTSILVAIWASTTLNTVVAISERRLSDPWGVCPDLLA